VAAGAWGWANRKDIRGLVPRQPKQGGKVSNRVEVFEFTKDAVLPKVPPPFLVDGILHRSQTIICTAPTSALLSYP
jgi:hypothetical protein